MTCTFILATGLVWFCVYTPPDAADVWIEPDLPKVEFILKHCNDLPIWIPNRCWGAWNTEIDEIDKEGR